MGQYDYSIYTPPGGEVEVVQLYDHDRDQLRPPHQLLGIEALPCAAEYTYG